MNPTPSPNSPGEIPAKPKPQPRPLPATLREFLFSSESPAKRFIAQALKNPLPRPDTVELDSLVQDVANSSEPLTKLAQAIAELTAAPKSQIAQQVAEIAERVCRSKIPLTVTIPKLVSSTSLEDLWRAVVGITTFRTDKPGRTAREQLVHFLLGAAWIKGAVTGSALADILLALETRKATAENDAENELAALLVRNLNKPGPRVEVLATYILQQERLSAALQDRQDLTETNRRLQIEVNELKAKERELKTQCAAISIRTQEDVVQIDRLTRDLVDLQAVARQSRRALRARFNGLLQGEISSLVRDAQAAAMEPVRPHIISDRLESLETIIKKETQWLESSE